MTEEETAKLTEKVKLREELTRTTNELEIRLIAVEVVGNLINAVLDALPELSKEAIDKIQKAADVETTKITDLTIKAANLLKQV